MKEFVKGPRFRLLLAILIACSFFMAQVPSRCDCSLIGFCEINITNSSSSKAVVIMDHRDSKMEHIYPIPVNQTIKLTLVAGWWDIVGYNIIDNKCTNWKIWHGGIYVRPGEVKNLTF